MADAELRGDSSALLQLCTPMPVWLPPNEPPLCGKAAILLWLEDQSETTVRRIEIANLQIFGIGSLACKLASFRTMIESPADDGPAVVTGTHAWLLQRDARRVADWLRDVDDHGNGSREVAGAPHDRRVTFRPLLPDGSTLQTSRTATPRVSFSLTYGPVTKPPAKAAAATRFGRVVKQIRQH